MIRAIQNHILLEPFGDAEKYPGSSLYIPASKANPEAQQGTVVSCGPDCEVSVGAHILFHPFRAVGYRVDGRDLLHVHQSDCVCTVDEDGDLCPFSHDVVIEPDFARRTRDHSTLVYIPPSEQASLGPVLFGRIIRIGSEVRSLCVGDQVIMEPAQGHEVGYIDHNIYILSEEHVLARIENDPD